MVFWIPAYFLWRAQRVSQQLFRKTIKLMRLSSNPTYWRGLKVGVAATIEHEDAIRALQISTLIDVGANIGQFSLLTRALHPHARIYAFEPLPSAADRYERLFGGDRLTTLYRLAAGERQETSEIHISGRPDSSSLLPITELQNKLFPGTSQASVMTIEVNRIDDVLRDAILPEPILIKLDVQGFELSALRGMPHLLQRARYVYAEVSFRELYKGQPLANELVEWLAKAGFRLTGAYNPTTAADGSAIQADFLFQKSE